MQQRPAESIVALLADRFLQEGGSWYDITTAQPVLVSIRAAGPVRSQIAWAEACAMLARLRHPLLNDLIDFGIADRRTVFEAYAPRAAIALAARTHARRHRQLTRFLQAHGVEHAGREDPVVRRPIRRGRHAEGRPVGVVLQPRSAYDAAGDIFAGRLRGGWTPVGVRGEPGSGMRTFVAMIARTARDQGYVVVCAGAMVRWPDLVRELSNRHVCLLTTTTSPPLEQRAMVSLVARLAGESARPHVMLRLGSRAATHDDGHEIALEGMGMRAMATMIYRDPIDGPSEEQIFAAARRSAGLPGRFLADLAGAPGAHGGATSWVVHESSAPYAASSGGAPAPPVPAASRSRLASALWRAPERGAQLAARGRHAAAARLLTRAARVFEGRGERLQAGRCWLRLAWLARTRGDGPAAARCGQHARQADTAPETLLEAGLLDAVLLVDETRTDEAEAALRSLLTASEAGSGAAAPRPSAGSYRARCSFALARLLCSSGRSREALDILRPMLGEAGPAIACEARALASRAHRELGSIALAVRSARNAISEASVSADARLLPCALREMAETLAAAGDLEGVRSHVSQGLRAAAAARLPLTALKLRAILLHALTDANAAGPERAALASRLQRALARPLPRSIRSRLQAACTAGVPLTSRTRHEDSPGIGDVEALLTLAQRARDDLTALEDVAEAVRQQLEALSLIVSRADGRVVAVAGRPWRERSIAVTQALTSGRPVYGDAGERRLDVAEPVRCAGELVGALGCRWAPGTPCPSEASRLLKAAAMVLGVHLRAVADASPEEPPPGVWSDLLGESHAACALRDAVQRASRAPFPVLVEGESGSGKELVARAVHRLSPRHARRFCAINCAALSDELLEAELFGHTRGAYTGAIAERAGLFEEADGGTLFLDEVGELSPRAQAKLLRVIQEGEVRRIGENLPRRVDVRIVAATNRRLELEAAQGRFRTDLRFRLDVLRIAVPPLRDRVADIPILAQHFWRLASARVGSTAALTSDALAALSRHDWPGNVRELQNAMACLAVHAPRRGRVSAAMLPPHLVSQPLATGTFEAAREEFERRYVRAALAQAGGQRRAAARALGMTRQGLAKMMRRLRIEEGR